MTTNENVSVWPYVGIYLLTTVVASLLWIAFVNFVPSAAQSAGTAVSVATILASTSMAYSMFVRRTGRLLERGEYWRIVTFSTAATLLFSVVAVLFSIAIGATTEDLSGIPAWIWIMFLVIGGLFGFCLNAAGFSNRFGKTFLKVNRAKQTQIDTEPFR